jgi:hypothetical protein
MTSLLEFQQNFVAKVLDLDQDTIDSLLKCDQMDPQKRFRIYRNNVFVSLKEVVKGHFPVIHKIAEDDFFNFISQEFITEHPPEQAQLSVYGSRFGDFLASFEPTQKYGYMKDLADLEYAILVSQNAENVAEFDPNKLTNYDPSCIDGLVFSLRPSVHLIASDYPVYSIWREYQKCTPGHQPFEQESEYVMVHRPLMDVELVALTKAEYIFLNSLQSKQTLAEAAETVFKKCDEFDLTDALHKCFQLGCFYNCKIRENKNES